MKENYYQCMQTFKYCWDAINCYFMAIYCFCHVMRISAVIQVLVKGTEKWGAIEEQRQIIIHPSWAVIDGFLVWINPLSWWYSVFRSIPCEYPLLIPGEHRLGFVESPSVNASNTCLVLVQITLRGFFCIDWTIG